MPSEIWLVARAIVIRSDLLDTYHRPLDEIWHLSNQVSWDQCNCDRPQNSFEKMCSTMPITTPVKKNKINFFFRLCLDVLLEVLFFSNRRRLGKLECVSSRFHWLVEHFINKKPFLRLDLQLNSWLVFLAKLVVYHKNWR